MVSALVIPNAPRLLEQKEPLFQPLVAEPGDHPFQFDHQVSYLLNAGYVLQPGDKITSTCTLDNTTMEYVPFGQSTSGEMCSQLVFAYPYGALQNGVISLLGATNSCW